MWIATSHARSRFDRLFVVALWCRLIEAVPIDGVGGPTYPVINDGFAELDARESVLYHRLLRQPDWLPIAPVFSGPPVDQLGYTFAEFLTVEVDTRVVVADSHAHRSRRPTGDESGGLSSALKTADLDVVERYLEREMSGVVAEGPLCWLRTGCTNRLVGSDGSKQSMEPAIAPDPPRQRQSPAAIGEAITWSVERHGVEPQGWSDRAIERFRNREGDGS